jgi:4a-hydroxytetrahydrobiopterin dehydratase
MPSSSEIRATLCLWGGCIRLLTSALTASLYRRIGHVLKPPDGWIKGVTSFLKPGVAELLNELIDWRVVDGHHLYKRLTFANFVTALGWLNRAGAICEEQGHHGDFRIGWGYLEIEIHTHKAGGLTRADAVLAAKFDALKQ